MQLRHCLAQGTRPPSSARSSCAVPSNTVGKHRRVRQAAAAGPNGNGSRHDEDPFRIRGPSPQQLERSWLEKTADPAQLADEFFSPYKSSQQHQPKVFVFVRHGHSTWNEQSRIQASRVAGDVGASVIQHSSDVSAGPPAWKPSSAGRGCSQAGFCCTCCLDVKKKDKLPSLPARGTLAVNRVFLQACCKHMPALVCHPDTLTARCWGSTFEM
jgi:hypothetical protein